MLTWSKDLQCLTRFRYQKEFFLPPPSLPPFFFLTFFCLVSNVTKIKTWQNKTNNNNKRKVLERKKKDTFPLVKWNVLWNTHWHYNWLVSMADLLNEHFQQANTIAIIKNTSGRSVTSLATIVARLLNSPHNQILLGWRSLSVWGCTRFS